MFKSTRLRLILIPSLLILFSYLFDVCAQQESADFEIPRSVLDDGGKRATSADFILEDSIAQPSPIGFSSSDNFRLDAGYQQTFEAMPFSSFKITKLKIKWKAHDDAEDNNGDDADGENDDDDEDEEDHEGLKINKIDIAGRIDLPNGYSHSDLDSRVTVMVKIGDLTGTDEVLMEVKKHQWVYNRKKHGGTAGVNMDIKKLKIEWDKKDKKPDKFKLNDELNLINDGSGIVTVTLFIPVTAGEYLQGTETITASIHKHKWVYHLKNPDDD